MYVCMYTHTQTHTLIVEDPEGVWAQPPEPLGLCCVLGAWGCRRCLSLQPWPRGFRMFASPCLQRTLVHRIFQARALQQPGVALVCVSCHSVCSLFKLFVAV